MEDVYDFSEIFFNLNEPPEKLQPILDRVVSRFMQKNKNDKEVFRTILQKYIRLYCYISQLITFEDVELEKLYVFARNLARKLPERFFDLPVEIQDAVDLDSFRVEQTFNGEIELTKKNGIIKGPSVETPHTTEEEKDLLSNIIKTLNETYGLNLTDEDKLDMKNMEEKLYKNEELKAAMFGNNTLENKRYKCYQITDKIILDFAHTKLELYKKLIDPKINAFFKEKMFEKYMGEVGSGTGAQL